MFKNLLDKVNNVTKDINIKSSLVNAQKSIGETIENRTKDIDIKSSLTGAQKALGGVIDGAKSSTESIIEKNWPKVEMVLYEGLIGLAENKLKDDKSLASAFETTYELMPTAIRLVLSREKFIDFCLTRKESILQKLSAYKIEKTGIMPLSNSNNEELITSTKLIESDSIYQSLLPEVIALCIAADGQIEESEIEMATEIIKNDNFIENKDFTINALYQTLESLMEKKGKSQVIFKIHSTNIINKIPKIINSEEKERINIIIEGMLSSVSEPGIKETKAIVDSIQNKIIE